MQFKHLRVLLFINNTDLLNAVESALEQVTRHSISFHHVSSLDEASALLTQRQVDAVIVENTEESENLVRSLTAAGTVPVLVIDTGSLDVKKAFEAGAADVLPSDGITPNLLDHVLGLTIEHQALLRERNRLMAKLSELIVSDDLTAVANRRHLLAKLSEEITRSNRTGHMFAVLMADLDKFNVFNSHSGHRAGDERLKAVAAKIVSTMRAVDFVARQGGDEFCIILPESTVDGVRRAIERIQEALGSLDPEVTVSIGVSFWRPDVSTDSMLREANHALNVAKERGGNCAVFTESPAETSVRSI